MLALSAEHAAKGSLDSASYADLKYRPTYSPCIHRYAARVTSMQAALSRVVHPKFVPDLSWLFVRASNGALPSLFVLGSLPSLEEVIASI